MPNKLPVILILINRKWEDIRRPIDEPFFDRRSCCLVRTLEYLHSLFTLDRYFGCLVERFSILVEMAGTFKNVICALGLFSLCFLGIPIRIDQPDSMEQEFKQFIEKHNKSYGRDPVEYERRLSYFKVFLWFLTPLFKKYFVITLNLFLIRLVIAEQKNTIWNINRIVVMHLLALPSSQILKLMNFKRCCSGINPAHCHVC